MNYFEPTKNCVFGKYTPVSYFSQKISKTNVRHPIVWERNRLGNEIACSGKIHVGLISLPFGLNLNIKVPHVCQNGKLIIFGVSFYINPNSPITPKDILPFLCDFSEKSVDELRDSLTLEKNALTLLFLDPICRDLFLYTNYDEAYNSILEEWKNFLLKGEFSKY